MSRCPNCQSGDITNYANCKECNGCGYTFDTIDLVTPELARQAALSLPVSNTGEWQPIETAPKDVDVLLAWESSDGKWEMEVGWAGHENKHKGGYSDGWLHGEATHWQPLPEAPL